MYKHFFTLTYAWIFTICCLFSLWILSNHFVESPELAVLLFPFGFRIGMILHCSKKYWVAIYGAELALIIALMFLFNLPEFIFLILASFLSLLILSIAHDYYKGGQWQRLRVIGLIIIATSVSNTLCYSLYYDDLWLALLCSITGAIMLAPSCYLVWSYLFQNSWALLTADFINKPINLRNRYLLLYLLLFIASIFIQTGLPSELRRFAPFCLAIPIILLAYRYGWQGALLATLFNSIALMATQTNAGFSLTDLLLSLSAQTLTGILLGAGIQQQRELNYQLVQELGRNKNLSRQLIKAEEGVRRDIARELHDEIGQNITAIRIQANMILRNNDVLAKHGYAKTIEELSLNIYDTTRGLLNRLRPKALDDLGIEGAIQQLVIDLEFESQKIKTSISCQINEFDLNDTLRSTLFRICQESLNNIIKYAKASEVSVSLFQQNNEYYLIVSDNGIGFSIADTQNSFGLIGIQERVQALGGKFNLTSRDNEYKCGTKLIIILPIS